MEANLRIRRSGLDQSIALVVHSNPHRLHRTNLGVQYVSHRHHVVEYRSLLSPFVVKQGQRIRQRVPDRNRIALFTSSSCNCVESSGIT